MPGTVTLTDLDERLPALHRSFDTLEAIGPIVRAIDPTIELSDPAVDVDVLKHWPGKRCTIRIRVADGAHEVASVIAKTYAREGFACGVDRMTDRLRRVLHGQDVVPAPFGVIDGFALQEDRAGHELDAFVTRSDRPFALLGRWLADLHDAPIIEGLRVKTARAEAERMSGCLDLVEPLVDTDVAVLRNRLCDPDVSGWRPVSMIHRDFHPGNVLWDGDHLSVIDFDWLAVGDPAADVGGFVAQLEKRAMFGRPTSRSVSAAEAFTSAYSERRSVDCIAGVAEATASTFLNLAADEVRRCSSDHWLRRASRLAERAVSALECDPEAR